LHHLGKRGRKKKGKKITMAKKKQDQKKGGAKKIKAVGSSFPGGWGATCSWG